MVQLQARLLERTPLLLGRKMTEQANKLVKSERAAASEAAKLATRITRDSFHYKRPANAPARRGREHAGGKFREALQWAADAQGVSFNVAEADRKARYWVIQEIGTGESATLRRGGAKNPQGRPKKGASYAITVRSQVGRVIPFSLGWGTGPRGTWVEPNAGTGQQLYLRALLKRSPRGMSFEPRQMHITRDITGQHFVRKGGQEGYREYRTSVLAAAQRAFPSRGGRP